VNQRLNLSERHSEMDRFAEQKQQFGRFEMFAARLPNLEKH
jgi:hypothetical protein